MPDPALHDTGARFEMDEQGLTSFANYHRQDGRLFIDYVFSPPELRGSGAAGRLMTAVGQQARAEGLRITPICSYAKAWLQRSRDFADLMD